MSGHATHASSENAKPEPQPEYVRPAGVINPYVDAIPAIKLLRQMYDLGLKEAKDVHDAAKALAKPLDYTIPAFGRRLVDDAAFQKAVAERDQLRRTVEQQAARIAEFERIERLREIDDLLSDLNADEDRINKERDRLWSERNDLTFPQDGPSDLDLNDDPF